MLFATKRKLSIVFKDHVIRLIDTSKPDIDSIRSYQQRFLPEGIILDGKVQDREAFLLILEECLQEWKVRRQEVMFLVPDSIVVVRKNVIPLDVQEDELKGYIFLEIGSTIHLPFENPVFDTHYIGATEQGQEVLLYAAPEEIVSDYAALLEELKLKPVAADISPFAIYRLYLEYRKETSVEHLLCIELDIKTANLSIFHGDQLVFMRNVRTSVDVSAWQKMRKENDEFLVWTGEEGHLIGAMQEILTEVDRVMNFYRFSLNHGKEQVTRILVTGDHPNLQQFYERLVVSTEITIDRIPEQTFFTTKEQTIPVSFYSCLGLSLKEVK